MRWRRSRSFSITTPRPGKRYEFCQMLDQFRKSLLRELDYRQEATNLTTIGQHLREFEHIVVPEPIARLLHRRAS